MSDFDPERYTITVKKEDTEDGTLFVGRVSEFPDVAVYEESRHEAVDAVVEIVHGLYEMYVEDGQSFPKPLVSEDDREYSGRLPLRVPKRVHKRLVIQAQEEGVSLNSHATSLLIENSALYEVKQKIDDVTIMRKADAHDWKSVWSTSSGTNLVSVTTSGGEDVH